MHFETIRCDVGDSIQTITLNRPDKLNAFNATMMNELIAAFDLADKNDDVRAVIIGGGHRDETFHALRRDRGSRLRRLGLKARCLALRRIECGDIFREGITARIVLEEWRIWGRRL